MMVNGRVRSIHPIVSCLVWGMNGQGGVLAKIDEPVGINIGILGQFTAGVVEGQITTKAFWDTEFELRASHKDGALFNHIWPVAIGFLELG